MVAAIQARGFGWGALRRSVQRSTDARDAPQAVATSARPRASTALLTKSKNSSSVTLAIPLFRWELSEQAELLWSFGRRQHSLPQLFCLR